MGLNSHHKPFLASQLYALSQGAICQGNEECHWCSAPCERRWMHDDPPPIPFVRSKSTAKRPSSLFVCAGCWLYGMKRVTVRYLGGNIKDRQNPAKHSWWVTEEDARAVDIEDYATLYNLLLNPPLKFSFSLNTGIVDNLLQLQTVNDKEEILADTVLHYTIDNIPHTYTIYELEEALRHGVEGKMPGARALVEHLGHYEIPEKKKKRGRPFANEDGADRILKRAVTK